MNLNRSASVPKPHVFSVRTSSQDGATTYMDSLRRQKLRHLIATKYGGNRGAFLEQSGLSKGRLSQLLDPEQPFGERAARNIEDRLGLAVGYFETLTPRTQQFAIAFDSLSPELQAKWEALVSMLVDKENHN